MTSKIQAYVTFISEEAGKNKSGKVCDDHEQAWTRKHGFAMQDAPKDKPHLNSGPLDSSGPVPVRHGQRTADAPARKHVETTPDGHHMYISGGHGMDESPEGGVSFHWIHKDPSKKSSGTYLYKDAHWKDTAKRDRVMTKAGATQDVKDHINTFMKNNWH
jgi:hypothetical protein